MPNWNELLSYSTVKIVKIRDWRLGLLHYVCMFGIICYIFLYAVWWKQGYLEKENPEGGIRASLQAPANLSSVASYPYCLQNQTQYNGSPNLQCIFMAGDQAYFPAGLVGAPFITTRMRTSTRDPSQISANCTPPTDPTCIMGPNTVGTTTTRYYIAGIEDYTLFIDHVVYGLQNHFAKRSVQMKGEVWQDNKKSYELDPNRVGDIFTIGQLLQYANVTSLDVPSGVAGSTGSLRYDGVQLVLIIEYSNRASQPTELKYRYSLTQIPNVDTARFEGSTSTVATNRHGIDIIIVQTGLIGQFSFPALLSAIVGGLVLMSIATTIVDLLAIYILPQKDVYGQSKFQMTKEMARTPRQWIRKEPIEMTDLEAPKPTSPSSV
eukprot:TRINITY_DN12853_c0_g1_i1.p1 TRINITY_DN12853_c0_g1~~TRINITY_DN12853_c0_g1_i1.p1  ORF type:complete len:378 (-),score=90.86 TRINITY_DN12853_c0_g1_i1:39-1172(-)